MNTRAYAHVFEFQFGRRAHIFCCDGGEKGEKRRLSNDFISFENQRKKMKERKLSREAEGERGEGV